MTSLYYTPEDAERAGFVSRHDVEYRGRVRSQGEALASRQWQRGTDADVVEGWELDAPPEAEVRYLQGRLDVAEARIAVLLAALNVALNDDDPEALEGAHMALEEIRNEDLTLLHERDRLTAALADEQARALAAKVAADGYRQRAERAEAWVSDVSESLWNETVYATRLRKQRDEVEARLAAVDLLVAGRSPLALFSAETIRTALEEPA
jgi:hypothetical protein